MGPNDGVDRAAARAAATAACAPACADDKGALAPLPPPLPPPDAPDRMENAGPMGGLIDGSRSVRTRLWLPPPAPLSPNTSDSL